MNLWDGGNCSTDDVFAVDDDVDKLFVVVVVQQPWRFSILAPTTTRRDENDDDDGVILSIGRQQLGNLIMAFILIVSSVSSLANKEI